MSTGSVSDAEDLQEMEVLGTEEECDALKRKSNKEFCTSNDSNEDSSNNEHESPKKGRGSSGKRRKTSSNKSPLNGVNQEGKQVQRNAANARERARMRVLSKAFSRLKTTLPWVPPDTKLSKLDTLRLASSYIAHLRQILANDKYENGYIHPVNLVKIYPLLEHNFSRGFKDRAHNYMAVYGCGEAGKRAKGGCKCKPFVWDYSVMTKRGKITKSQENSEAKEKYH